MSPCFEWSHFFLRLTIIKLLQLYNWVAKFFQIEFSKIFNVTYMEILNEKWQLLKDLEHFRTRDYPLSLDILTELEIERPDINWLWLTQDRNLWRAYADETMNVLNAIWKRGVHILFFKSLLRQRILRVYPVILDNQIFSWTNLHIV